MKKTGFTLIEMMIVIATIGILSSIGIGALGSISDGSRSGVVTKISHKGIFSKTWEGQLMLGSGNSGNTWDFSIQKNDPKEFQLVEDLKAAQESGSVIAINYHQTMFFAPWNRETTYAITGVKRGHK